MDVAYPHQVDRTGRTVLSPSYADHIRDLIEQLLFTSPGERVNRPTFGAGLLPIVFMPNGVGLAAVTQAAVQGALNVYLGDRITVQEVTTTAEDSTLTVFIAYTVIQTQQSFQETFTRSAG
jgi:phage baseplate assembly protein W